MTVIPMEMISIQVTAGQHQITWAPILWAQRDVKHAFNDGLITSDRLFIALHRSILFVCLSIASFCLLVSLDNFGLQEPWLPERSDGGAARDGLGQH